jgi:hypothetical protein
MADTRIVTGTWTHTLPARDARGRFVRLAERASRTPRMRALPARDSRGRFVAYPTSQAPSWYVFSADGYRIPGEPAAPAPPVVAAPVPHSRPCRAMNTRRPWFTSSELQSAFLVLLVLIATAWYAVHLPPPHW